MSNCSFAQNRQHSNTSFPFLLPSLISQRQTDLPLRVECQKIVKKISCEAVFCWMRRSRNGSFKPVMCSLRLSWRSTRTRIRMSEEETRTTRHGPGSSLFDIPSRSFSVSLSNLSEWLLSQEPWNPAWKKEMNISNFGLYILFGLSFYSIWRLTSPQ